MTERSIERINPTRSNLEDFFLEFPDHLQRYEFALTMITPAMAVADIACGVGYGSWLMAQHAACVVGIDISDEALSHAKIHFNADNIQFVHNNQFTQFAEFDLVVSFETIEHLNEVDGDRFLQKIRASLRKNGKLIISTPINRSGKKINVNEYHLREYDEIEFMNKLVKNGFTIIDMYGQGSPFHKKLYGEKGSEGLAKLMRFQMHRLLPRSLRNQIKNALLGDPNKGLTISKADWRSAMVQIAVCKV